MEGKNSNIITTILVVVLIGAAFYIGKLTTEVKQVRNNGADNGPVADGSDEQAIQELPELTDQDHVRGDQNAKIVLFEYSDIECPYCQQFHPTAKQAVEDYGGQLKWVFRHFPLDQIHPDARPAAIATECVNKLGGQDKFWTYLDTLYDTAKISSKDLLEQATALGIDGNEFTSCLSDKAMEDIVDADFNTGLKAGVNGTPGNIVVNLDTGEYKVLPGAVPLAQVKAAVDALLGN